MEINKAIKVLTDYESTLISCEVTDAINTLIRGYYELEKENKILGFTKNAK